MRIEKHHEKRFKVKNLAGIHALAATQFVRAASRFASKVELEKDGQTVDGKSVIEVLTLAAARGSVVTLRARGRDAEEALAVLGALLESHIGGSAAEPSLASTTGSSPQLRGLLKPA
jgi:phosphocarrier protein HPr